MAAAEFVAEGNAAASWRQGGATDDSDDVESEGCSTPMLVAIVAGGVAAAIGLVFVIWCVFYQEKPPAPDGKPPAPDVKPSAPEEVKTPARQAGVTDIEYAEAKTGVKVVGAFAGTQGFIPGMKATVTPVSFTVNTSPMSDIKKAAPALSFNMFAVEFQNEKDAVTFDEQVNQATLEKDFVTHFRSDPGCDKNDCDPKKAQHQLVVKTLSPKEAQKFVYGTKFPYDEMYVPVQGAGAGGDYDVAGAAMNLETNRDFLDKQKLKDALGLAKVLTKYHDEATDNLKQIEKDLTANLDAKSLGLNEDSPTFADDDSGVNDEPENVNGQKVCRQTATVMQTFYLRHSDGTGVLPKSKVSLLDLQVNALLVQPTGTDRIKDAQYHETTPLFAVQYDLAENGVRGQLEFNRDIWAPAIPKGKAKAKEGTLLEFKARTLAFGGPTGGVKDLTRTYEEVDQGDQIKRAKKTREAKSGLATAFTKFCRTSDRKVEARLPRLPLLQGLRFGNAPLQTLQKRGMTGDDVETLRDATMTFVANLIKEAEGWSKIMKSLGQGIEAEADTKMKRLEAKLKGKSSEARAHRELARALEHAQTAAGTKGFSLPETIRFVIVAGRIRMEGRQSRDVRNALGMNKATWEWPTRMIKSGAKKISFHDVPREVVNEGTLDEEERGKMHSIVSKVDFKRVNQEHTTDNMGLRKLDFGKNLLNKDSVDPVFEARARLGDMFEKSMEEANRAGKFSAETKQVRTALIEALENVEICRAANYEAPKRSSRDRYEEIRNDLLKAKHTRVKGVQSLLL